MAKINDYSENTTANESDVYIQETTSGPRKITFSTILNGIISKFLKSTQKSSLTATNKGTTSSREYAVGLDANGQMSVNVPWVDTNTVTPVVNNLTSTSTTSALSAAQGKYLQSEITDLNSALSPYTLPLTLVNGETVTQSFTAGEQKTNIILCTLPSKAKRAFVYICANATVGGWQEIYPGLTVLLYDYGPRSVAQFVWSESSNVISAQYAKNLYTATLSITLSCKYIV